MYEALKEVNGYTIEKNMEAGNDYRVIMKVLPDGRTETLTTKTLKDAVVFCEEMPPKGE